VSREKKPILREPEAVHFNAEAQRRGVSQSFALGL
jgi:hypothetical protein